MSRVRWYAHGELRGLSADVMSTLLNRATRNTEAVRQSCVEIIAAVRRDGDAALRKLAKRYDGVDLDSIEVSQPRIGSALDRVSLPLRRALERAANNIAEVHTAFIPQSIEIVTRDGVVIGRRSDPLGRVGVYAPGGRAVYPSSVLMGVVPAHVAGVPDIIVCSPPASDGVPPDVVLAAAAIGGAHRVFAVGGAGAIAAMAYATETVPRVDRIVGPGNAFVAAAKLLVVDTVGIDSPAGPSELLVLADGRADVAVVAHEVLAQAEHDPMASVVVVSTDSRWGVALEHSIRELLIGQPRAATIQESLASRGAMLSVQDMREALTFASEFAPEHLLLAVADPDQWLPGVRNAGTVFVGEGSSATFGDYLTGANHVLPTGGLARTYSGLSTQDFMRWTTYQRIDRDAAARLADDVETMATAEALPAHGAAAHQWSIR